MRIWVGVIKINLQTGLEMCGAKFKTGKYEKLTETENDRFAHPSKILENPVPAFSAIILPLVYGSLWAVSGFSVSRGIKQGSHILKKPDIPMLPGTTFYSSPGILGKPFFSRLLKGEDCVVVAK